MFARDKIAGGVPRGRLGFAIAARVRATPRRGTSHRLAIQGRSVTTALDPTYRYPAISRALKK